MKNKKLETNDGHYIELLDRLYLQTSMIERYLKNHPLSKKIKKVRKLINKAGMSLAEAYQIVGHESYKKQEKNDGISKVVSRRRKGSSN